MRSRVERALERAVRENRATVAVVVPLVGAAILLGGSAGVVPRGVAFDPWLVLLGVAAMRLPLLAALAPLVDRRAAVGLAAVSAYAYAIEFVGVTTGLPYGEFRYLVDLGPMVGAVPVGLPLLFVPLALDALLLAVALLGPDAGTARRVALAVGVTVALDLALDPGAVALGFWAYDGGGPYYGVPLLNFAGWVVSATVTVGVLDRAFDTGAVAARLDACEFALDDLVSFAVLWGVVNAVAGNWLAVGVTLLLGGVLVGTGRVALRPWRQPTAEP